MYINAAQSQHKPFKTVPLFHKSVDFAIDTRKSVNFSVIKVCRAFRKDPSKYISTMPKMRRAVLSYLRRFRKTKRIAILNETIAERVGCSVRTVQNHLRTLMDDGLIYRWQDYPRAVSDIVLHPALVKGSNSHTLWVNELTPQQQIEYMDHGILPGGHFEGGFSTNEKRSPSGVTFTLNINSYSSKVLFTTSTPTTSTSVINKSRESSSSSNNFKNRKTGVKQPMNMNKNILKLDANSITPTYKYIGLALSLSKCQKLNLFAYPDSCLDDVYEQYLKKDKKLGYGWFDTQCKAWCKEHGIKPNWKRYYDLCEAYGIDPKKEALKRKTERATNEPQGISEEKRLQQEHKLNAVRDRYVKKFSKIETAAEKYADMKKFEQEIEKYRTNGQDNPFKKSLIELGEQRIANYQQELADYIEDSPEENNEICDTREPDTISQTTLLSETRVRQTETPETSSWDQPKEPTRISTLLRGYASS